MMLKGRVSPCLPPVQSVFYLATVSVGLFAKPPTTMLQFFRHCIAHTNAQHFRSRHYYTAIAAVARFLAQYLDLPHSSGTLLAEAKAKRKGPRCSMGKPTKHLCLQLFDYSTLSHIHNSLDPHAYDHLMHCIDSRKVCYLQGVHCPCSRT
jgi:hypothetical protein